MRNQFMEEAASICRAYFRRNLTRRKSMERAELSCRTYYSPLDGILSPEEWIAIARGAGVRAIAITDFQDVKGFRETAQAMEKLRGETGPGELDFKVLYGLETVLEDGCLVHLLVQRQEGLPQLYRLLEIAWQGREERPFLRKAELSEHRTGLLVGCPGEDGELYRGILGGFNDARLEEIAGFYDYLSVPSLWLCDLPPAQEPASSGEAVIRKIIAIGKRSGRPVVAAGNVRTADRDWGMFRSSAAYGIQKDEGEDLDVPLPDLLYTQEMLDDFSFLEKGLAEEIVIHTPNRLADLCGEIRVLPEDERCVQPILPDAFQTAAGLCQEQLQMRYGGEIPEAARARLEQELAVLRRNELLCSALLISRCLVQGLREKGYPVSTRPHSYVPFYAHSYAAYLLGVAEADPLSIHPICEAFGGRDMPDLELLLGVPNECLEECWNAATGIFSQLFPLGAAVSFGEEAGWEEPSRRRMLIPNVAELHNWTPLLEFSEGCEGYMIPNGRPEEFPNVFRLLLWPVRNLSLPRRTKTSSAGAACEYRFCGHSTGSASLGSR